jgi:hypothetical protein
MPTTVTASNSQVFHLWQLTEFTAPEPEDTHDIATIDNPLTDGYRAGTLVGFNAGTRSWRFALPTLASLSVPLPEVTGPNEETVTREEYVRAVFDENKVSGQPFVIEWKSDYYFVDVADPVLSMGRAFKVKLFSTGFQLKQRRIAGVTLP